MASTYSAGSLICVLLMGCSGVVISQAVPGGHNGGSTATGQPAARSPTASQLSLCGRCNCSEKAVICDNRNKISDLVDIHIPKDFNIVDLSSNQLTRIHENSFIAGVDVTEMNLAYNQISSIADFAFAAFKNLTKLTLSHNHLTTLEDDSFAGLPRLENLDLSMNKFRRLNPEYLAPLSNLKYLILSDNQIEGLHGSIFRNNTRLTHLYMSKMSLASLNEDLFQYTPKVQILHLDDNFFETVPSKALSKLTQLETLILSGNPIAYLAPLSFPQLPNLQRLMLHNMQHLLRIEIYAFSDLPMLRDLRIQNCNALYYIDPKAFALNMQSDPIKYPSIKHLVIHDTSVKALSKDLLDWDGVDDLDLAKNKFHCNCNFSWAVEVVKRHEVNMDIRCASPDTLANQVIGRLQQADMLCDDFVPYKQEPHTRTPFSPASTGSRAFSVLHFVVIVMFTTTIVLSILLIVSVRRRGFLYRKLGKPQPVYAAGENVLYMRTTIDNY